MILYFSGTGNSQFVANCLNDYMQQSVVSVNDLLKKGHYPDIKDDTIIFIFPIYCGRMPKVLFEFIQNCQFSGQNVYFIATYHHHAAFAEKYCRKICMEKGLKFRGFAKISMPQNHITMTETTDPGEVEGYLTHAIESVEILSQHMMTNSKLDDNHYTIKDRIKSVFINPIFEKHMIKATKFYVTSRCVGCGKCAKVCPVNNIEIRDRKPLWKNHCMQCTACINLCPMKAIEYTRKTSHRTRYHCPQYKQCITNNK